MDKILILADLTSPLMKPRILMLKELPYQKYILHNANNIILSDEVIGNYDGFVVLQHPLIKSVALRYWYSFFYTLYILLRLRPRLVVVHWASRLYQNLVLALWGKRAIVHTMGGEINPQEDCHGKKKFFTGILLRHAKLITGKTDVMQKILLQNFDGVSPDKLEILSWGVEERFFHTIGDEEKRARQCQILGRHFDYLYFSIRTFKRMHFHYEILQSFVRCYGKNANIGMLVSTHGIEQDYFHYCYETLNLKDCSNIIFDAIVHEDMDSMLQMVDCVISYKLSDGISQSIMESVATKRWVIANRLDNHAMLLSHRHNAYMVDDYTQLPEAMEFVQKHRVKEGIQAVMLNREAQQKAYWEMLHKHFDIHLGGLCA